MYVVAVALACFVYPVCIPQFHTPNELSNSLIDHFPPYIIEYHTIRHPEDSWTILFLGITERYSFQKWHYRLTRFECLTQVDLINQLTLHWGIQPESFQWVQMNPFTQPTPYLVMFHDPLKICLKAGCPVQATVLMGTVIIFKTKADAFLPAKYTVI